jgi:hypothetical protein
MPRVWGQKVDFESGRAAAERGRREYNLGHWQQSIEGFVNAYRLTGDAAFLFNLGQAYRQLGQGDEALRLYWTYLREKPNAPNRDVAEKQIKELEAREGHSTATKGHAAGQPTGPAAPPVQHAIPSTAALPTGAPLAPAPPASPVVSPTVATTAAVTAPTANTVVPPLAARPPAGPVVTVTAAVAPATEHKTPLPRWTPLAAAVLTIGVASAATAAGQSASSRFDELKGSCGQTSQGCTSAEVDGVRNLDRAATILWASAGLLAAATGVTIVVNTRAAGASALWRF